MRPSGRECSTETYWSKARAAAGSCQQNFLTSSKVALHSLSSHAYFPFPGLELSEMVYCAVVLRKGTAGATTAVRHPLHDRTGLQEVGPHRPHASVSHLYLTKSLQIRQGHGEDYR